MGPADASAPLANVDGGTTPSQRPEASFDLEAAKTAAQAANQLGFAVHARLADANGNAVFSPASLAIALGIISSGARGQTLEEMRHVLHAEAMPAPDSAFSALLASMTVIGTRDETSLKIENRLWAQQGAHFNPDLGRRRARRLVRIAGWGRHVASAHGDGSARVERGLLGQRVRASSGE
jgi:hypothetical protein